MPKCMKLLDSLIYLSLEYVACRSWSKQYDDCMTTYMLWWPELTSLRVKYLTLANFGNILLMVGHLRTGHISVWFSLAGSKHNLTFLLGFGISMKLLHPFTISSTPSCVIIFCCCSHYSSSLNIVCNA